MYYLIGLGLIDFVKVFGALTLKTFEVPMGIPISLCAFLGWSFRSMSQLSRSCKP